MSLIVQNLLSNSNPRLSLGFTNNSHSNPLKPNNYFLSSSRRDFANLPRFLALRRNYQSFQIHHWPARAFEGVGTSQPEEAVGNINFDAILSVLEFLCLASSAMVSIGLILNKSNLAWLGNRVFVWQSMLLIGAMAIGAAIRCRQWRRVCNFSSRGSEKVNLVERIEKLEEDLRSSATIIRVLSRQLEKLGIRFRVTRKTLKDPIAEAVSLAQKNSEATRALAAQEDILEKELSEIQKVLLAMQEQQQKQLELILALGGTGKLWDVKLGPPTQEQEATERHNKPTEEGPNPITAPRI